MKGLLKLSFEWEVEKSKTLKDGLESSETLIGVTNVSFITNGVKSKLASSIKWSDLTIETKAKGKSSSWKTTSLETKMVFVDKSNTL